MKYDIIGVEQDFNTNQNFYCKPLTYDFPYKFMEKRGKYENNRIIEVLTEQDRR